MNGGLDGLGLDGWQSKSVKWQEKRSSPDIVEKLEIYARFGKINC